MKRNILLKKVPLLLLASALVLTVAYAQTTKGAGKTGGEDTVPAKQKKIRDLDDALLDLDRGEAEMQKALQEINGEKMEREMRAAMKNMEVDMTRMKAEIARAMKEIDVQKINVDVQKAMEEVQREAGRINGEKIKEQTAEALARLDAEKMRTEWQKANGADLDKLRMELNKIRPEMEKAMQQAKKDIEKARQEINSYKELVHALDKDGYLDKDAAYKVEYKAGELTVNGKKLPADAVRKYNEFLSGKREFTLHQGEDGLHIRN